MPTEPEVTWAQAPLTSLSPNPKATANGPNAITIQGMSECNDLNFFAAHSPTGVEVNALVRIDGSIVTPSSNQHLREGHVGEGAASGRYIWLDTMTIGVALPASFTAVTVQASFTGSSDGATATVRTPEVQVWPPQVVDPVDGEGDA